MTDLKPCPFCGGEAKAACSEIPSEMAVRIRCSGCGCERFGTDDRPWAHNSEIMATERAIAAWNRRAPEAGGVPNQAFDAVDEDGKWRSGQGPHPDPCPWCGTTHLLAVEREPERGFLVVKCRKCGAMGRGRLAQTPLEAKHLWNDRHAPALDRDAILEQAAVAVAAHDRIGREWVKGSLWDDITMQAVGRIRALKGQGR